MKKKKRGRPSGSKNCDKQLNDLKLLEPGKRKLIKAIWKLQPDTKKFEVNLSKFTIKELEFHLNKLKRRIK